MVAGFQKPKHQLPRQAEGMVVNSGCGFRLKYARNDSGRLASLFEYGARVPLTPQLKKMMAGHGFCLPEKKAEWWFPELGLLRFGMAQSLPKTGLQNVLSQSVSGEKQDSKMARQVGERLLLAVRENAREKLAPQHPAAAGIDAQRISEGIILEVD